MCRVWLLLVYKGVSRSVHSRTESRRHMCCVNYYSFLCYLFFTCTTQYRDPRIRKDSAGDRVNMIRIGCQQKTWTKSPPGFMSIFVNALYFFKTLASLYYRYNVSVRLRHPPALALSLSPHRHPSSISPPISLCYPLLDNKEATA